MKRTLATFALVFVAGLVIGIATRPTPQPPPTAEADEAGITALPSNSREPRSLIGGGNGGGISLSQHFESSDRVENGLAAIALSEQLSPDEFGDLLEANRDDHSTGLVIAKRWAETEPEAFYQHLLLHPGSGGWRPYWEVLFRTWVEQDPTIALTAARRIPYDTPRYRCQLYAVDTLLQRDWREAIDLIAETGTHAWSPMRTGWIHADPGAVAERLLEFPSSSFRREATEAALKFWFKDSPEDAIAFVSRHHADLGRAGDAMLSDWAKSDPAAAAAFALDAGRGAFKVVESWSLQDPEAAWNWAERHLLGIQRREARRKILEGGAQSDPQTAVALINTLPEDQQERALDEFAKNFMEKDQEAALSWAHSQTDPEFRGQIFRRIGHSWAQKDFRNMGKYVQENAEALPESFVTPLANRWGGIYPKEAMSWQTRLPDELALPAVTSIMSGWANKTPAAAGDFVLTMDYSDKRAAAVSAVSHRFLRSDFDGAVSWLAEATANHGFSEVEIRRAIVESSLSPAKRDAAFEKLGLPIGSP